jgi:hypothetical protein
VKSSPGANSKASVARERLRRRYRPKQVRILFVGEAPPASGRFFYQADSGLYRAIRDTFVTAIPALHDADFLESFRSLGCYLVDLCARPVDRLGAKRRRQACIDGEVILVRTLKQLRPRIVVTVVRSIAGNVARARQAASWNGLHLELPYPGRWQQHRIAFKKGLVPILRRELGGK